MIYYSMSILEEGIEDTYVGNKNEVREYIKKNGFTDDEIYVTQYKVTGPISKQKLLKILNGIGCADETKDISNEFKRGVNKCWKR